MEKHALSELTNVNPPLPAGEASTVMIFAPHYSWLALSGELSAKLTERANAENQNGADEAGKTLYLQLTSRKQNAMIQGAAEMAA